jgi:alpha-1,2-mannosyltransferase
MSVIVASDTTIKPQSRRSASLALTGCLALFLLCNGFVLNNVLRLVAPAGYTETVLDHAYDVLHADSCDDSWGILSKALKYTQSPHATPLYKMLFFKRKLKFQYPPSAMFPLAAMLWLAGPDHVRTSECQVFEPAALNDVLGWLFILISAASTAFLLERGLRRHLMVPPSDILLFVRAVIVCGLALTFYPIVKAFTLGQIQLWLNGIFAVALVCWATGRRTSSGVLIGLMCLVKPHYGLFVVWAMLRREWRFTIACVATGILGIIASIAAFGWTDNVDYLRVFWFLSQHGEVYFPNQSLNGLLNRLMSLVDPEAFDSLEFDDFHYPPFVPSIYVATLVSSTVILAAALLRRGNDGDPDRAFDFCTMALSITIASPIAWEHHYGILLPVFAVLLTGSLGRWPRLVLIGASYVVISNFYSVANMLAWTYLNFVQSYVFFAALVVLMLLHTARPGWQLGGFRFARLRSPGLALKPQ